MKEKILQLLRQQEGFLSGQQLCDQLGVSRTAVWKVINQLRKEGYQIQAVQNKGYCIVDAPDEVTLSEVTYALHTKWLGKTAICLDIVDSTNLEAKRQAENHMPDGTLVVADQQRAGRGRRGRAWASPSGNGLWFSFVLKPDFPPMQASMVTLLAAMAVQEAIAACTGIQTQIKWPNDIVYDSRKVCGILTEMNLEENQISYIVVGIGINANMEDFPEELQQKAISLKQIIKHDVKRADLLNHVLCVFEDLYEQFCQSRNLKFMQESYNQHLVHLHKPVQIIEGEHVKEAVAQGINAQGGLEVIYADGKGGKESKKETLYSGEISVRGIYGYV